MSLQKALERRRSVRHYGDALIDADTVRRCLRLAQLAPSSSNMQLYEFYHITDAAVLKQLTEACLGQKAAATAPQMVVFVTRQDLHRSRAQTVLDFERGNIQRNSPPEKQDKRIKDKEAYLDKLMPFIYARCFGLRAMLAWSIGLFRPMMRDVSEADMRIVVHKSCGLSAQTFMLAMAEAGYDTCPMEGLDSRRVKHILNLPRGAEINMVVSCGIRKEGRGIWGERHRLPFEDIYRRV